MTALRTHIVVGAGFSGTMLAAHLLRLRAEEPDASNASNASITVVLVEQGARFGAGVAYRQASHRLLLNVRASGMSAFPDRPDHFVQWARARDPSFEASSFAPRSLYGDYLRTILDDAAAVAAANGGAKLVRIHGRARAVRLGEKSATVELEGGVSIAGDHAVLALGPLRTQSFLPGGRALAGGPRYFESPWDFLAGPIDRDEDILVLGTGLTLFDIVATLHERGHRGTIHAVSRHALLPQPHVDGPPMVGGPQASPVPPAPWPTTTRGLVRRFREAASRAAKDGRDWRDVVQSIRADSPHVWSALSGTERARFLRHVLPYWNTHRHRAPPSTAATVTRMLACKKLVVRAGRLIAYDEDAAAVTVAVRDRGSRTVTPLRVARVVNATNAYFGPAPSHGGSALVEALVEDGLLRTDALKLGVDTSAEGRAIGRDGRSVDRLWVLGPMRCGQLWEQTAVPELRVAAEGLAETLNRECRALRARE